MLSRLNPDKLKTALVSESKGELLDQMPRHVNTFTTRKYPSRLGRMQQLLASPFGINLYERSIASIHHKLRPDYWYLNTVLMLDKLPLAKKVGVPVIAHFHELESDYALATYDNLKLAIDYATLCIADSMAVYRNLEIMGAKRIALQYECVDLKRINPNAQKTAALRKKYGLDRFSFIWLMSGTSILRKGIDMVAEVAAGLKQYNAALLWLGNNTQNGLSFFIEQEIKSKGLENIIFLGKQSDDYYSYMDLMDGFVLLSREEPFGMVVVEALALGKPVVAFDAGGVSEIVTEQTGKIVKSWNMPDLVNTLGESAQDNGWFNKQAAMNRAAEFDVDIQVKNWERILLEL